MKVLTKYAKDKSAVDADGKFGKAQEAAVKARDAVYANLLATENIKNVRFNPVFEAMFKASVYKNVKLTTVKEVDVELKKIKDKKSEAYKAMNGLKKLVAKVTDEEREAFDKKFKEAINTAATFAKAGVTIDAEVRNLAKAVDADKKASDDVKAALKLALSPVEHRATLNKVSDALSSLSSESNEVEAAKLNEGPKDPNKPGTDPETDGEAGGSAGAIIGAILGVLVVVGGVAWCKCNKKFCFEDKEAAEEGGETDKTVYKQEVKSKNSHKRHAKESLMPAFKVADEQA